MLEIKLCGQLKSVGKWPLYKTPSAAKWWQQHADDVMPGLTQAIGRSSELIARRPVGGGAHQAIVCAIGQRAPVEGGTARSTGLTSVADNTASSLIFSNLCPAWSAYYKFQTQHMFRPVDRVIPMFRDVCIGDGNLMSKLYIFLWPIVMRFGRLAQIGDNS